MAEEEISIQLKKIHVIKCYEKTYLDGHKNLWAVYESNGRIYEKNIEALPLLSHRILLEAEKHHIENNSFLPPMIQSFFDPETKEKINIPYFKSDEQLTKSDKDQKANLLSAIQAKINEALKIEIAINQLEVLYRAELLDLKSLNELIQSPKKTPSQARTNWKKSKAEFARFVCEQYEKHKDEYASLRDATIKLFSRYKFEDSTWTVEQCYDMVRKV